MENNTNDIEELNQMQVFVNDYEYAMDEIENLIQHLSHVINDKSLKETIDLLPEYITINEGIRYCEYKDKLEDLNNFNMEE